MILAVLQARYSSTRLPGKILKPILGRPMVLCQIDRLRRSKRIGEFVLATSDAESDNPVAEACAKEGIDCFRGSLDDVLDRFYRAAVPRAPEHVIRLTGDCPLADPAVIDKLVDFYLAGNHDYASNCFPPTFPDGLDAEIFRFSALERAFKNARLPSEREHVTPYLRSCGDLNIGTLTNPEDLSAFRWTVDEPADFAFVSAVYERLFPNNPVFGMADVLALVRAEPRMAALNAEGVRNAGYQASIEKDRAAKRTV